MARIFILQQCIRDVDEVDKVYKWMHSVPAASALSASPQHWQRPSEGSGQGDDEVGSSG